MIVIAVLLVLLIVALQVYFFVKAGRSIRALREFFPAMSDIGLYPTSVERSRVLTTADMQSFLRSVPPRHVLQPGENPLDWRDVTLLTLPQSQQDAHPDFGTVARQTNAYLCKNLSMSPELGQLQDIAHRRLEALKNDVESELNVPLYLGLAGTFIGIIVGLVGLNAEELFSSGDDLAPAGLANLLHGVVIAMCASLAGLCMTVYNSAFAYKSAQRKAEADECDYYDLLRREMLPTLTSTIGQGLEQLRGVLSQFITVFGQTLTQDSEDYKARMRAMSESVREQRLLLSEVHELKLSETAAQIVATFKSVAGLAKQFDIFTGYQQSLCTAGAQVTTAAKALKDLIDKYSGFEQGLRQLIAGQEASNRLMGQFQSSLEQHFPTGGETRSMWKSAFEQLLRDAETACGEQQKQLSQLTRHTADFLQSNKPFLVGVDKLNAAAVSYSEQLPASQKRIDEGLQALQTQLTALRGDLAANRQALLEALTGLSDCLARQPIAKVAAPAPSAEAPAASQEIRVDTIRI